VCLMLCNKGFMHHLDWRSGFRFAVECSTRSVTDSQFLNDPALDVPFSIDRERSQEC
jgi:hypothetical protein